MAAPPMMYLLMSPQNVKIIVEKYPEPGSNRHNIAATGV